VIHPSTEFSKAKKDRIQFVHGISAQIPCEFRNLLVEVPGRLSNGMAEVPEFCASLSKPRKLAYPGDEQLHERLKCPMGFSEASSLDVFRISATSISENGGLPLRFSSWTLPVLLNLRTSFRKALAEHGPERKPCSVLNFLSAPLSDFVS